MSVCLLSGGYDRGECLRTVELYDPLLNRWSQLPSMREARGRFDITVIEGKVYAVGGCNGTTELATAEVYSSDNSKWTALPPLELARSNVGTLHLSDFFFYDFKETCIDYSLFNRCLRSWRQGLRYWRMEWPMWYETVQYI